MSGAEEKKQTKLEDFVEKENGDAVKDSTSNAEKKRKAESSPPDENVKKPKSEQTDTTDGKDSGQTEIDEEKGSTKLKEAEPVADTDGKDKSNGAGDAQSSSTTTEEKEVVTLKRSDDTDEHSEPIKINRAPVLDLFASCAAQFEHPDLKWETCLSIGSAIATMCAISKGRSIGKVAEKDGDKESTHKEDDKISALGFNVPVRDHVAYVGESKKPANESYLRNKFGDRYDEVKEAMTEALKSWKGHEDEFTKKGFHMYEKFRPGSGQWGQKGGLEVENVRKVIMRP